jgi:hypothetical protein
VAAFVVLLLAWLVLAQLLSVKWPWAADYDTPRATRIKVGFTGPLSANARGVGVNTRSIAASATTPARLMAPPSIVCLPLTGHRSVRSYRQRICRALNSAASQLGRPPRWPRPLRFTHDRLNAGLKMRSDDLAVLAAGSGDSPCNAARVSLADGCGKEDHGPDLPHYRPATRR